MSVSACGNDGDDDGSGYGSGFGMGATVLSGERIIRLLCCIIALCAMYSRYVF